MQNALAERHVNSALLLAYAGLLAFRLFACTAEASKAEISVNPAERLRSSRNHLPSFPD